MFSRLYSQLFDRQRCPSTLAYLTLLNILPFASIDINTSLHRQLASMMEEEQVMEMPLAHTSFDAALVPLPETPNDSFAFAKVVPVAEEPVLVVEGPVLAPMDSVEAAYGAILEQDSSMLIQSPSRKAQDKSKPMSPEKAALAAMFDSIKMPAPSSPTKSPRKASGSSSSILTSPSKQIVRDTTPSALSLFRQPSSPSKGAGSSDSAASRHFSSRDSPHRRPVVISSSSPSHPLLRAQQSESGQKASTPLSPASAPKRTRPSILNSSSSPSARLSDLSLILGDTTGTQELLFNQDASFLAAAANTAADVTIDDSFDVSRAKARIRSASSGPRASLAGSSMTSTRRSSPAKFAAGMRAKPRCSMVPEEGGPVEYASRSPARRERVALGSRGLGIGKVVKNAAGDETIELNLTGSFLGNTSMVGGNLMDESGEVSLLFGNNSFSISHAKGEKKQEPKQESRRASSGDEDDDDEKEEEDYEQDAKNVQKWAAEAAARRSQLGRTPLAKASLSTVTRGSSVTPSPGPATITKPISRIVARPSLVTPTAGSRLLKPRASLAPTARPSMDRKLALPRSGSATTLPSAPAAPSSDDAAPVDPKTPMRQRRKSTFTSSRPPVSGPARRRESLAAAAAGIQPQPIPPILR